MKLKKIACALMFALLLTGFAQADVVQSINNWEATDLGTSNETGQFAVTVVADGDDWLYTWTKTGNLDGLGTANDTLSFDLRSSAFTGSSFAGGDLTLGTAFDYSVGGTVSTPANQHFGPGSDIDTNQSFQLSIENISFTQGEGLDWETTFCGFTAMGIYANPAGNQTFYIGTTGAEVVNPAASGYTLSSPQQMLTVTSTANNKRIRDIDFAFKICEAVAVPEPTSAATFALVGLGLMFIRRRK